MSENENNNGNVGNEKRNEQQSARGKAKKRCNGDAAFHLLFSDFAALHLALRTHTVCAINAALEVAVVVGKVAKNLEQHGG